jgi:hydroxymethylglutaryl-CoA reductase (NADPH)
MRVVDNHHIYVSIYMPSVMAGLIGGGTHLKTKQEALSLMRVETVAEYAQVLGAAVLAGELSLLASLSEGSLARAHETLGR